jgi:hypothetical protein
VSEVVSYAKPYPNVTDRATVVTGICPAMAAGGSPWKCVRPNGHEGRHEAGGPGGVMYASWSDRPESGAVR